MAIDSYIELLILGLKERALGSAHFIKEMLETEFDSHHSEEGIRKIMEKHRIKDVDARTAVKNRVKELYLDGMLPGNIAYQISKELKPYYALQEQGVRNNLKNMGYKLERNTQYKRGGRRTFLCEVGKEGFKRKRTGRKIIYQSFCSVPETL